MKTVFIKPINGNVVFDPATKTTVPNDGMVVEKSYYWMRRAAEGGVSISEVEPTKVEPPKLEPVKLEKQEPQKVAPNEDKS